MEAIVKEPKHTCQVLRGGCSKNAIWGGLWYKRFL